MQRDDDFKEKRLALGITQDLLGKVLGASQAKISLAERGLRKFTEKEKERLRKILAKNE